MTEGTELEYTLTFLNAGNITANNVQITDQIPSGSTFVSASDNGSFNNATRVITWNLIGSLAPQAGGTVSFRVRANCGTTQLVNSVYAIRGNNVNFPGSPLVTTPVMAAGSGPIGISISSAPDRDPLQRGDLVTHTISLTELAGAARGEIQFGTSIGSNVDFEAVVDDAGGMVTLNNTLLNWAGPLAANATINVVFTVRVQDCTPPFNPFHQLNFGNPIQIRNTCGVALDTASPPPPIFIIQPMQAELALLPPVGPPQFFSLFGGQLHQVVRPGMTVDLRITLTNRLAADQPAITASIPLPAGLTAVGDPPFILPTTPGAAWDAATQTVSWSGAILGNSTAVATVRAMFDPGLECQVPVELSGSTGPCDDITASLVLHVVPLPPVESHLLGLFANFGDPAGLWTFRPGIDSTRQTLFCINHEILGAITCRPDGEIWVTGLPFFRLNPYTIEFQIFPEDFAQTLGLPQFESIGATAFDSTDGTMLLAGGGPVKVFRYDAALGNATVIFDGSALTPNVFGGNGLLLDPDRQIAFIGSPAGMSQGIIRFDPAAPAAYQHLMVPSVPSPSVLTASAAGHYLVANSSFGVQPLAIAEVDRTTGVETVLVPDLNALFPTVQFLTGMNQAPDGTIYAASPTFQGNTTLAITLTPSLQITPLPVGSSNIDLCWVERAPPPPVPGDLDHDGDVDRDDYDLFLAAFGSAQGDPNYDPDADLDMDGDVDCDDWDLFRTAAGPLPVPAPDPCRQPLRSQLATPAQPTVQTAPETEANCAEGVLPAAVMLAVPLGMIRLRRTRRRRR